MSGLGDDEPLTRGRGNPRFFVFCLLSEGGLPSEGGILLIAGALEIDFGLARAQEVTRHRCAGAVGPAAGCLGADGLDVCVAQANPAGTGSACPVVSVPARAAKRPLRKKTLRNRVDRKFGTSVWVLL